MSQTKKFSGVYLLVIFVAIGVFVSSYFYPRTRDEFYYLANTNTLNVFEEYYNAYLYGNPRLGQFFANLVGRNLGIKLIFNPLLFFCFIGVLYLNVFRKLPTFKSSENQWKFLGIASVFILLIGTFGELFYYVPFNTNYTFTHIAYLGYLYLLTEYYFYQNNIIDNKNWYYPLAMVLAFFMGMCNEHVPPVLIGGSFLLMMLYGIKNKKFPHYKIIALVLPVILGYLVLFFAPANRIKFKVTNAKEYGFQFSEYIKHWISLAKNYFYYAPELLVVTFIGLVVLFINIKKIKKSHLYHLLFLLFLAVITWCIVAYSPLQGVRLLLFSNSLFIIFIIKLLVDLYGDDFFKFTIAKSCTTVFMIVFFSFSMMVCWKAHVNYEKTMTEISELSKKTKQVELDHSFDYENNFPMFRRIILDSGKDYIDTNPKTNTLAEHQLIDYFRLKSIVVKMK